MLALDDANLDAFIACASALNLKPQAPVPLEALKDPAQRKSWIKHKPMVAFALIAPDRAATVDALIEHPLNMTSSLAAALRRDLDGVPVSLCAIEDLIRLKQGTGRRQDAADIEHLRRIQGVLPS